MYEMEGPHQVLLHRLPIAPISRRAQQARVAEPIVGDADQPAMPVSRLRRPAEVSLDSICVPCDAVVLLAFHPRHKGLQQVFS
jgi:hypothetical protein